MSIISRLARNRADTEKREKIRKEFNFIYAQLRERENLYFSPLAQTIYEICREPLGFGWHYAEVCESLGLPHFFVREAEAYSQFKISQQEHRIALTGVEDEQLAKEAIRYIVKKYPGEQLE